MTFFQLIQDHRRSCIWYSDDLFFTNLCLNPQIHFSSFWRPKYLFLFIGNLLETVLSNCSGKKHLYYLLYAPIFFIPNEKVCLVQFQKVCFGKIWRTAHFNSCVPENKPRWKNHNKLLWTVYIHIGILKILPYHIFLHFHFTISIAYQFT